MKLSLKPLLGFCLITGLFFSCKKNVQNTGEPDVNSSRNGDTIMHKLNINGNLTIIKQVKDEFYFAHDILLSKEQFNSLKRMTLSNLSTTERSTIAQDFVKTWPDAKVYYSYPDATTMPANRYSDFVKTIDSALATITDSTNIQFIERTTQPEYMKFVEVYRGISSSPLGWEKNRVNTVRISIVVDVVGIMHEVLHSLGVAHEQSRPDRDNYIIVNPSAITPGYEMDFNKYPTYSGYGPFDFNSIMLYTSDAFGKDRKVPTMTKLDGSTWTQTQMPRKLSQGDVNGLKHLYFPLPDGTYRIRPGNISMKSVAVNGSSAVDGTRIVLSATDNTKDNQKFIFRKVGNGVYQIKSLLDTTKVLTITGGGSLPASKSVELKTNTSIDSQKFSLYNLGNDGFGLVMYNAPGFALRVVSSDIKVGYPDAGLFPDQKFKLTKL